MKSHFGLAALFLFPCIAGGQDDLKARLRRELGLPHVTLREGMGFNSTFGFFFDSQRPAAADEASRLEKALTGDAADAERYVRLQRLYRRMAEGANAAAAERRALAICRAQLQTHPRDARWLALLGQTLASRGEAEKLLRQAVKESPRDVHAWLALAGFLEDGVFSALLGDTEKVRLHEWREVLGWLRKLKAVPGRAQEFERAYKEVKECYDRAIALEPKEADPYVRRANSGGMYRVLLAALKGTNRDRVLAALFTPEYLADLRKATRYTKRDYALAGFAIVGELAAYAAQVSSAEASGAWTFLEKEKEKDPLLAKLPRRLRAPVKEHLESLKEMVRTGDKETAGGAAECLGLLSALFEDSAAAEGWLRRAIAATPTRDKPWRLLTFLLAQDERYADIVVLLEQHTRIKKSAFEQFLLAKAHDSLKEPDRAEAAVRAGLQLEPGHFLLKLALATVFLQKEDPAALAEAGKLLTSLKDQVKDGPADEARASNFALAWEAYRGLVGDADATRRVLDKLHKRRLAETIAALEKKGATVGKASDIEGHPVIEAWLADPRIRDTDVARLQMFPRLRHLALGPSITAAGLAPLKDMKELRQFDMPAASLTEPVLEQLRRLHLQELHLADGDANEAVLARLDVLPDLRSLGFSFTKSRDPGLDRLKACRVLEELQLSAVEMSATGIAKLKALPNLRSLSLFVETFADRMLLPIGQLHNLEYLSLDGGLRGGLTDDGIAHLKGLKKLRVLEIGQVAGGGPLSDKSLLSISSLSSLRELSVSSDATMTAEGLMQVAKLRELRRLQLPYMSDKGLSHLKGLHNLEFVSLHPKVTDAGLAHVGELAALKELNLTNCRVTAAGLGRLKKLTKLQTLDLSASPMLAIFGNVVGGEPHVTAAGLQHLQGLPALQVLKLANQKLDAQCLSHLADLTQLRELDLSGTGLSDAGLVQIAKLTRLERLNLNGNPITDAGLKRLQLLTSLKWIDLSGTKTSERGVAELRKARPALEVEL